MAWRRPPSFLQPITCPLKGEFVVCSEKGKKERRTDDGRANRRRKGRGFRPSVRPSCLAHGGVGDVDGLAGAELPIPIDTMPQSEGERVETAKVCMGVPPSHSSLRA